jgi:hypothetical protein
MKPYLIGFLGDELLPLPLSRWTPDEEDYSSRKTRSAREDRA